MDGEKFKRPTREPLEISGSSFHKLLFTGNFSCMHRLIYLFILLLFTSCSKEQKAPGSRTVQVTDYVADPVTIPAVFSFAGRTESSHLVEIRARVEGYLEKIAFQEGSMVQEGQLLFLLDSKPFQAALDSATAELNQQKAILWRAEQDAERLKPLYEQKAASKKDLDAATSTVLATQAAVESAAAKVDEAKLNLGYTKITAPSKGLSSQSSFRVGALITPGSQGLLTTISSIDPVWVMFSVSENELLKTRKEVERGCLVMPKNMDFDVQLELGQGEVYDHLGKVDFANPSFDTTTGMQSVRAVIPNPKGDLKPGQFVRVNILGAKRQGAMLVPKKSVLQGTSGFYVYAINGDNKVEVRNIDVGDWYEEFWIVKSGLDQGTKIVVDGTNKIEQGATVQSTATIPPPSSATPFSGPACNAGPAR